MPYRKHIARSVPRRRKATPAHLTRRRQPKSSAGFPAPKAEPARNTSADRYDLDGFGGAPEEIRKLGEETQPASTSD
jgi:hypothetical protein